MRRKAVFGTMLTLLLISMLTWAFNVQPVESDWTWTGTIYIRADGNVDPSDAPIWSADNITYTLTDNIVGDVPASSSAVVVQRNNIVVDGAGYTLQGTGISGPTGIYLSGRQNVTIRNMEIKRLGIGIYFSSSSNSTISESNIENNHHYGIYLYFSSDNNFVGNNITNNNHGVRLINSSGNNIIRNNLTANQWAGVYFESSSNNTIIGNDVVSCGYYGIYIHSSSNNNACRNNVSNNSRGISLYVYSNNNSISENAITSNSFDGISLCDSSDNVISKNNITANNHSMDTWSAGIHFSDYSNSNRVSANNIVNNSIHGIRLRNLSNNNSIFHNNFINNDPIVDVVSGNIWDNYYPSGGNYWSDYNSSDFYRGQYQNETGSDGMGDTPYVMNAKNQDNYPLTKPYPWGPYDTGITQITMSKSVVARGYTLHITIAIMNYGKFTESSNVSVFYDDTIIILPDGKNYTTTTLPSGNSTSLTLTWNTTGVAKGNYIITAEVTQLPGETDTTDNTLTDGWVIVAMVGDFTGSGYPPPSPPDDVIDINDIRYLIDAYKSQYDVSPPTGVDPTLCDLTGPGYPPPSLPDGKIDINDIRYFIDLYKEQYT